MKKNLTRILSLLLVLVLMVGVLPVSALADGWDLTGELDTEQLLERAEPVEMQASASDFSKILHLDCGRKYFTKDWIIALLYEMQAAGYNQLQLAFGNDGLRFLLNDMSFTANGKSYSHDTVVSKVEAGNRAQNSSNDSSWLTEAEMDAIIAKATELGIEIVPLLNLPGHANALLDIADDTYNATGSNNTLNVVSADDSARNFGMAIFKKYVDYFHSKGCNYFNFGADEYANDASGLFSFSRLTEQEYARFASFINSLAAYIVSNGMTPRAFNDGLYYNKSNPWDMNTSKNTSIKSIQCCYWSSGWDAYPVATASQIAQKTHSMINTHGDFYYVLGKSDKFDSGYSYASGFYNTTFAGGTTITNPVGSMFCIWCDYPNAETETVVAQKTRLVLRAMAARMDNKSIDTISKAVVANGFNEDGTLNNAGTEFKIVDCEGGTTPTLEVGKALTLCIANGASAVWSASPADIVQIEVPDSANANRSVSGSSVKVTALQAGNVTITATNPENESQTANFALTVSDPDAPRTETVTLTVGQEVTRTQDGVNNSGADKIDKSNYNANIASVSVTGTDANQEPAKYTLTNVAYSKLTGSNRTWTKTAYFYRHTDNNYYPIYGKVDYFYYYYGYSLTDSANSVSQLGKSWTDDSVAVYAQTPAVDTPASTTITFKGLAVGETSIKVGNVTYNITVTKENLETVTPLSVEYWITNARIYTETNGSNGSGSTGKQISAAEAYDQNGYAFSDLIQKNAFTNSAKNAVFWKGTLHPADNKQTTNSGDDKTNMGTDFQYVRYWDSSWSYSNDRTTWTPIDLTNQVVAYYMQVTEVTDEVTTTVVDWGENPFGTALNYLRANFILLDFAVKYESGERSPDEFPVEGKTIGFHCDGVPKRTLGRITPFPSDTHEVYMITLMPSDDNPNAVLSSSSAQNAVSKPYTYSGTEKVVWVDKEEDLGKFDDESLHHTDFKVGGEATIANGVTIYKGQGVLVTYYIRATAMSKTPKE